MAQFSWVALVVIVCIVLRLDLSSVKVEAQTPPPTDPDEISALVAFKTRVLDNENSLVSWSSSVDPCNGWVGVICDRIDYPASLANSNFSHVTELRLLQLGLAGELAPELGNLTALKYFDVMWNNMTGSIPPDFGRLSNLFLLLLNGNQFTGVLPDELGNLTTLNRLQIDQNNISGRIPDTFANLRGIQHLHMNNNSLNGSIPPGLGRLPNVVHILLDNNQLTGSLPVELSQAPQLLIIQLDNNRFDTNSSIPAEYGQIPTLLKLSLRNCNLQGTVPDMNLSTNLGVLDLSFNSLTGPIPESFPPAITAIDLAGNNISGSVPDSLGSLQNLSFLVLGENHLQGSIPPSLGTVPLYRESDSNVIWDFQNNNISSWPNNDSLVALSGTGRAHFWFAGNPICQGQSLSAICQPNSVDVVLDVGVPAQSSSNRLTSCSQCRPPLNLVPDASQANCRCAIPITVGIRLKSPGFNVFDLYELQFRAWIAAGLDLQSDQVDVQSYVYEPGPRLRMTLLLFPLTGTSFNFSEVQRLYTSFSTWTIADSPIFGPYEFISITFVNSGNLGHSGGLSSGAVAGIVIGALAFAVIFSGLMFLLFAAWVHRRYGRWGGRYGLKKRLTRMRAKSTIKVAGVMEFTYEELAKATDKFSEQNVVGEGGYGKVFVGVLEDGQQVAIKRAEEGSLQGSHEFETEILLMSRVHHRNLLGLVGYCNDEGEQMLVYEYMKNGTVEDHLLPKAKSPLDFPTRLRVALGAARGIHYLHTEANPPIFHRDIKATNILLDAKFIAKVADFGLSKLAPISDVEGMAGAGVSTAVKGTPGYLDPEYFLTHKLTDKSDVYSFGVLLLVLLTGRPPIVDGKNVVRETRAANKAGKLPTMVDPSIAGSYSVLDDVLEAWGKLGLQCCKEDPDQRPTMGEVVRTLERLGKESTVSTIMDDKLDNLDSHNFDIDDERVAFAAGLKLQKGSSSGPQELEMSQMNEISFNDSAFYNVKPR